MGKEIPDEFVEKEFWVVKDTKSNRYYKGSISSTKENAQKFLESMLSHEEKISANLVKVNLTEVDDWRASLDVDRESEPSEIVGGIDED